MELSRNLRIESVARLDPTPPLQLEADHSVLDAVVLMRREYVGCLLITKEDKLVGIFTERDLLTRVLAVGLDLATPVKYCMTLDPVTVDLRDPIRMAVLKMQEGGYRHLPVVDEYHRPVGILSAKRIIYWIVAHFPHIVHNLPPTLDHTAPRTQEGA